MKPFVLALMGLFVASNTFATENYGKIYILEWEKDYLFERNCTDWLNAFEKALQFDELQKRTEKSFYNCCIANGKCYSGKFNVMTDFMKGDLILQAKTPEDVAWVEAWIKSLKGKSYDGIRFKFATYRAVSGDLGIAQWTEDSDYLSTSLGEISYSEVMSIRRQFSAAIRETSADSFLSLAHIYFEPSSISSFMETVVPQSKRLMIGNSLDLVHNDGTLESYAGVIQSEACGFCGK